MLIHEHVISTYSVEASCKAGSYYCNARNENTKSAFFWSLTHFLSYLSYFFLSFFFFLLTTAFLLSFYQSFFKCFLNSFLGLFLPVSVLVPFFDFISLTSFPSITLRKRMKKCLTHIEKLNSMGETTQENKTHFSLKTEICDIFLYFSFTIQTNWSGYLIFMYFFPLMAFRGVTDFLTTMDFVS